MEIYGYHRQDIEERLKEDGYPLYLYNQASSFCREMSGTPGLFQETTVGVGGETRDDKFEEDSTGTNGILALDRVNRTVDLE